MELRGGVGVTRVDRLLQRSWTASRDGPAQDMVPRFLQSLRDGILRFEDQSILTVFDQALARRGLES